jgi:hypothetical protein
MACAKDNTAAGLDSLKVKWEKKACVVSCCTSELQCVLPIESRIQCAHWDRCRIVVYDKSLFYLSFIGSKVTFSSKNF